jgi:hypothetical protein
MDDSDRFYDTSETRKSSEEDVRLQRLLKALSDSAMSHAGRVRWIQHLTVDNILLLASKVSNAVAVLKVNRSGGVAEYLRNLSTVDALKGSFPFAALLVCTTVLFSWLCWIWRHRWLWMLGHSVM